MAINDTVMMAINNPDCAFFVGQFSGFVFSMQFLFILIAFYYVIRFIDKLAFDPLLQWIKSKLFKK